jgi:transcriptional regulator with XRE-family HTH domain
MGVAMNLLDVFGHNLRILTVKRGSISHVATDLEIGRVQFQRFLKGESFPKPQTLDRICRYFGVDARILTERIDAATPLDQTVDVPHRPANPIIGSLEAMLQGRDMQASQADIADGLYIYWTPDGVDPATAHRKVLQIKTRDDMRMVRMIHGRWFFPPDAGQDLRRQREITGVVLSQQEGLAMLILHAAPGNRLSFLRLRRNPVVPNGAYVGTILLGRPEVTGVLDVGRFYLEPVPPGMRSILQCARMAKWLKWPEVPPLIREYLQRPL